jgi:hypothetical protein
MITNDLLTDLFRFINYRYPQYPFACPKAVEHFNLSLLIYLIQAIYLNNFSRHTDRCTKRHAARQKQIRNVYSLVGTTSMYVWFTCRFQCSQQQIQG